MTQFLGAGNDLFDNIRTDEKQKESTLPSNAGSLSVSPHFAKMNNDMFSEILYFLLDFRNTILEHSNFARVLKFYLGPQLKELLAPAAKKETLNHALTLMKEQLNRFVELGEQHNFTTHIFLIHPVQDILRGSYRETILKFETISPTPIHSTARLFSPDPEPYYYPLDGHLNEKGSRKIADYVLSVFSNLR